MKELIKTVISIIIIGIIAFNVMNILNTNKANLIIFKADTMVEYGSDVDPLSFIDEVDGEIIDITPINSYQVSEQPQTITYQVKKDEHIYKYDLQVKVIDSHEPIIELRQDKLRISKGIKLNLKRWIHVYDIVDGNLKLNDNQKNGSYQIISNVDYHQVGNYDVKIIATDINGNRVEKNLEVEIIDKKDNEPYYINDILLVNKSYYLPNDYGQLDEEAYNAVLELIDDASSNGYDLPIISSYRSYATQKDLYESYVARDGEELANRYSAKPGTSEHQSGLAFDLASLQQSFGDSQVGKWLAKHCSEYGFIIRYPQGKEEITGYMYEPWHVRYIGQSNAQAVFESGLTLEEYLGVVD